MSVRTKKIYRLEELRPGAVVRNLGSGDNYIVVREGKYPVVAKALVISNPDEWVQVVFDEKTGR